MEHKHKHKNEKLFCFILPLKIDFFIFFYIFLSLREVDGNKSWPKLGIMLTHNINPNMPNKTKQQSLLVG